ncbi:MAG: alginate export family protein [Chitinophagaceae bacterium]
MYPKSLIIPADGFILFACSLLYFPVFSQTTLSGQLRTRSELRNGTGTLKPVGNDAAFFTSQRTRLTLNHKWNKVIFQTSVQDVRVWGQDASTISNNDGNKFGIHEAWANIILANVKDSSFDKSLLEYFSLKIGRQELLYDDSRLLGNLDWLQQARRHDAVVFKLLQKGWQADLGLAFNQNTDAFNYNGTYYTPANLPPYVKDTKGNLVPLPQGLVPLTNTAGVSTKTGSPFLMNPPSTNGVNQNYKAMQFFYVAKKLNQTSLSFLLLSDQFGKYKLDSVRTLTGTDTGYVFGRRFNQKGVNNRLTTGILLNSSLDKRKHWSLQAGFYYQGGNDRDGLKLSAYTTTASLSFSSKLMSYTAGWDYVSGNDAFSSSSTNHRFDPLYGTPHKFWGYMDYFYAGTGSPVGGLSDPYFKIKYVSPKKNLLIGLDYHYFSLARDQRDNTGKAINKYLGSEFDLVGNYNLNKITTVELGLAYLAAGRSMEYAKAITPGTSKLNSSWAYLQINVKPEFFSK